MNWVWNYDFFVLEEYMALWKSFQIFVCPTNMRMY